MIDQPKTAPQRKAFFNRRFLWLLIFILIPLIPLLNNLGPSEAFLVEPPAGEVRTHFALAEVEFQQEVMAGLPVTWAPLPASGQIRISVLSDRQPLAVERPPETTELDLEARHGRLVATLTLPLTTAALQDGTRFLNHWLPVANRQTRVVMTGELTPERTQEIASVLAGADAPGVVVDIQPPSAVTRLTSPPPGTEEHLHFALAMDLLRQRLSGYNATLRWSHRGRDSLALLNTTLDSSQRQVPSEARFLETRAAWATAQGEGERPTDYIHRQLVTLAAYDVAPERLPARADELAALDYATFTTLWEQWLGTAP
ncbi:hypothetical protein E4656_19630 [Natronospirillum operosum]|uniref:Uncharacterized protein n=1 Tax=Natronospirillum operosum TaxID=2759953 RepID=A0A4Z0WAR2_9GAMM|nr:hypothetical protein [Natronospirillum operosum]TGG90081.1 hypothetical protein E4656_19630 [Natronospirillum operosum]